MTREEWLEGIAAELRADTRLYWVSAYAATPKFLSSFPSRPTRRVTLGDFARQDDGSRLALVSPLVSSSLEVSIIVYWLLVRHDYRMWETRSLTTRGNGDTLNCAGFNVPFNQVIPKESLIDKVQECVNRQVARHGEYPAADVNPEVRRTQTTRLLKMVCNNHTNPYILRMSQSQLDRGAPLCGVCHGTMIREG